MRISWLSADVIAAAREALTADGKSWDDHFIDSEFVPVPAPEGSIVSDWPHVIEHVARAERVSQVVREFGLDEARDRFAKSRIAIEAATLAAAAHEGDELELQQVIDVLRCSIDHFVFYAPFLELLVVKGKHDVETTLVYEAFVDAYERAVSVVPRGLEKVGAVRDGFADYLVSAGKLDEAEALFQRRHAEDRGDVAVALSASRAFLAAGSVSHAVRWLGVGAERATELGRSDLATRLLEKQGRVRERLS